MGRTKSGAALQVRRYPAFSSPGDERLYRKQHLAAAYRIFAARGFDEGVAGHISVRDPILTDHFWLNPLSTHFSLMRVSDLILVNEEGEVVEGNQPINAAAFAIHSAIHRRRPDVHAACHAHSVYGKAFSAFGRELSLYTQDSCRFYKSHGVYKQFGGVVLATEEGERIADALGTALSHIVRCIADTNVQAMAKQPSSRTTAFSQSADPSTKPPSGSFPSTRRAKRNSSSTLRLLGADTSPR
jgi:ribulose-5-phosphate 4-epimerase/fuculose-1-phosphate aldolase